MFKNLCDETVQCAAYRVKTETRLSRFEYEQIKVPPKTKNLSNNLTKEHLTTAKKCNSDFLSLLTNCHL